MSEEKVEIVTGDYSAENSESLLAQCEKVKSEHDGMLHAGIIHYIQGNMPDFTLKAAISQILDKCPAVWPLDLPEKEPEITKEIQAEFTRLNKGLIIPIGGYEISEIIRLAKEFLANAGVTN